MSRKPRRKIDEWDGCYNKHWKGLVAESAMSHPAKFSRALIERIYRHYLEEGWLVRGDIVLDPFGGVALGALEAITKGIHWRGVEIEKEFVDAGVENITLWNKLYSKAFVPFGLAVLLHGDSRNLDIFDFKNGHNAVVSSPPFLQQSGGVKVTSKAGPLSDPKMIKRHLAGNAASHAYGESHGQVQKLKEGSFGAVITSPPFVGVLSDGGGGALKADLAKRGRSMAQSTGRRYSKRNKSNAGEMREGDFRAVITSPPYAESDVSTQSNFKTPKNKRGKADAAKLRTHKKSYGDSDGQLQAAAVKDTQTFWEACYLIVAQCYAQLKPGAHATWICKDYVRKAQVVPFSDRWRQLCEKIGFITLHEHHAMLVRDDGTQQGNAQLGTDDIRHVHERKSFFKRAAEKKGQARIDWEVVFCMQKPLDTDTKAQ